MRNSRHRNAQRGIKPSTEGKRNQPDPRAEKSQAKTGSGFAVTGSGDLLTNYHVIAGCKSLTVSLNRNTLAARIVAVDKKDDLALLRVGTSTKEFARLRKGPARQGESVMAVGYP